MRRLLLLIAFAAVISVDSPRGGIAASALQPVKMNEIEEQLKKTDVTAVQSDNTAKDSTKTLVPPLVQIRKANTDANARETNSKKPVKQPVKGKRPVKQPVKGKKTKPSIKVSKAASK